MQSSNQVNRAVPGPCNSNMMGSNRHLPFRSSLNTQPQPSQQMLNPSEGAQGLTKQVMGKVEGLSNSPLL